MQVRRSRPSSAARPANDRAALHVLPDFYIKAREVRVVGGDAAAVIHDDHVAVAVIPTHKLYRARIARPDRITPLRLYVDSRMKFVPTSKRVASYAESASYADAGYRLLLIVRGRTHRRNRYRDSTRAPLRDVWRRRDYRRWNQRFGVGNRLIRSLRSNVRVSGRRRLLGYLHCWRRGLCIWRHKTLAML